MTGSQHQSAGVTRQTHFISMAAIYAVAWTAAAVCILLTVGRLIIRWRRLRKLCVDDILNTIAAVLVVPFSALCLLSLPADYNAQQYNLGRVDEEPTRADFERSVKLELAILLLFWLIIYVVKASFLALYWQIFSTSNRFRVLWWLVAGFTAISFGATWISVFWQCGSPSNVINLDACESMDPSIAITLLIMWCTLNVLGGILLMALPIVMVTSRMLTLERSAKVGLIFIFSLVLIDIAFDVIRTTWSLSEHLTYDTNLMAIWSFLEPTIAVAVCALPCYKSLVSFRRNRTSSGISVVELKTFKHLQVAAVPVGMDFCSTDNLQPRTESQDAV